GFDDYYVMREGVDEGVVALGMYRDRARAEARAADLRGAGFGVRVEPFGGGEAEYWVDARVRAGFDAGAAGERLGAAQVLEDGCAAEVDADVAR
ncbi:sporulation protein, partial [Lysobacter defluvii IMMIB APB-9 = DSM 18482]